MSVQVQNYLIHGIKFGEDFTNEYWEKDFRDEMEWNRNRPQHQPFFITDGMCGNYTFFGFIVQLSDGWEEPKEVELDLDFNKNLILEKLKELYPELEIKEDQIKTYYLPHWV